MKIRNLILTALMLALMVSSACAQEGPPAPPAVSPFVGNVFNLTQQQPLSYDQEIAKQPLADTATSSATLLQVRTGVKTHYHAYHDELVYVISGKGVMEVGDHKQVIQAGDVISLVRGTVHSLTVKSTQPMVAISVISPPFDGIDRIYVGNAKEEE
ncbi:cupin domain-containing protein [bacterium]|nr:cupin domain-containing protein [bacterium]